MEKIFFTHSLKDHQFGKNTTITMSQRDVPGITRSVIPLLSNTGVKALSIGANSLSAPAAVPPIFIWKDAQSSSELITLYHPGGYGGITKSDCVFVPGFNRTLAVAFNGDNAGPQTWQRITILFL